MFTFCAHENSKVPLIYWFHQFRWLVGKVSNQKVSNDNFAAWKGLQPEAFKRLLNEIQAYVRTLDENDVNRFKFVKSGESIKDFKVTESWFWMLQGMLNVVKEIDLPLEIKKINEIQHDDDDDFTPIPLQKPTSLPFKLPKNPSDGDYKIKWTEMLLKVDIRYNDLSFKSKPLIFSAANEIRDDVFERVVECPIKDCFEMIRLKYRRLKQTFDIRAYNIHLQSHRNAEVI